MDIRDIQWGGLHAIGMLLALWLSASILYHGRDILIPITGSILFAYLLLPLVRVLERWFNRPIFAIIVTLLGVFCVAAVIISLMVFELTSLYNDLPQLRETITTYVMGLQNIINRYTDINPQEQLSYISNWMGRSVDMLTAVVFQTLTSLVYAGGLIIFFIFLFIFLFSI